MCRSIPTCLILTLLTASTVSAAAPPRFYSRCGQVCITGNESTPYGFILNRVPIYSGMVLKSSDLDSAERTLAATCLFRPAPSSGRYISLLENPHDPNAEYKDLLIKVEELPHTKWVWVAADCTIHPLWNRFEILNEVAAFGVFAALHFFVAPIKTIPVVKSPAPPAPAQTPAPRR